MIKKRLVFYFYGFDGYENNRAIRIHLKCLTRYRYVFDEALFVISVDDINNTGLTQSIINSLMKCGYKDATFKIHKNNDLCESQVFYDEIVSKMSVLDGLTFFGHTKGISNYTKWNTNSIDEWIIGMYYLNLENINDVESSMMHYTCRFYGAFLTKENDDNKSNRAGFCYSGTFFWINAQSINNDISLGRINNVPSLFHRGFTECFPGNMYEWNNGQLLGSYRNKVLYVLDLYTKCNEITEFLLDDKYEDFIVLKKEIGKAVN